MYHSIVSHQWTGFKNQEDYDIKLFIDKYYTHLFFLQLHVECKTGKNSQKNSLKNQFGEHSRTREILAHSKILEQRNKKPKNFLGFCMTLDITP